MEVLYNLWWVVALISSVFKAFALLLWVCPIHVPRGGKSGVWAMVYIIIQCSEHVLSPFGSVPGMCIYMVSRGLNVDLYTAQMTCFSSSFFAEIPHLFGLQGPLFLVPLGRMTGVSQEFLLPVPQLCWVLTLCARLGEKLE